MKYRIIIVNNNMKIGGIQKALLDLLCEISPQYDITLYLFNCVGAYLDKVPSNVKIERCNSLYKYYGMSQAESKKRIGDYIRRSFLAVTTKLFGRKFTAKIISAFTKKLPAEYDVAISYMHDSNKHTFYGGCNNFVASKIKAKKKITFLHCDYEKCGNNCKSNNVLYEKFDCIAACSEGCRQAFARALPQLEPKTVTVVNCHNYKEIIELSTADTVAYDTNYVNVIIVARLNPEKGVERAIYALKYALDRQAQVRLHIVGNGILMESLINLCKELNIENNVSFYGEQTNPYRYIKNADLLFISSIHEAAPLVIDEAICLGVPVFSTQTTSSEDMIVSRNCGWVCDNNQESINSKFYELVTNKGNLSDMKKIICERNFSDNNAALSMLKKIID